MRRTVVLIRHAKTHPAGLLQRDYDRTLTGRGEQDAAAMGARLHRRKLHPALIIASPAKRTAQTAALIAAETGCDSSSIRWEESLYQAPAAVFDRVIAAAPDDAATIFIIAHNPGITDFANELSSGFRIDNIPTCGIVAAAADAAGWQGFAGAEKEILLFDYPKQQT